MKTELMRSSKEFKELVRAIQIEYLKNGKKAPSTRQITKKIAEKVNREDLLYDRFIRF